MDFKPIIRKRVDFLNTTSGDLPAIRHYNTGGTPILESTDGYAVTTETAVIDLEKAPLDATPRYELMIFCDIKDPGLKPPNLEFGPNFFKIETPIVTVDDFIKFLDDALLKASYPYNLGHFDYNLDGYFTYSLQTADSTNFTSGDFRVHFNSELSRILQGFSGATPIQSQGQLWYELIPTAGGKTADIATVYRLNKIKYFQLATSLCVTQTGILDKVLNIDTSVGLLGTIEMNPLQYDVLGKFDWRYTPTLLRYYTLSPGQSISSFSVSVYVVYFDGTTCLHVLAPGERFDVNICFTPLGVDV